MSQSKELESLIEEIADLALVNTQRVNLCQVTKGWAADVFIGRLVISDTMDSPILAMQNLLAKLKGS